MCQITSLLPYRKELFPRMSPLLSRVFAIGASPGLGLLPSLLIVSRSVAQAEPFCCLEVCLSCSHARSERKNESYRRRKNESGVQHPASIASTGEARGTARTSLYE